MSATTDHMGFAAASGEDDGPSAAGRITSRRIDAEVVARLQKAFDSVLLMGLGLYTYIEVAGAWDRFELLRGIFIVTFAAFAFLTVAREAGGYDVPRLKQPSHQLAHAMLAVLAAFAAAFAAALGSGMAMPWVAAWTSVWFAGAVVALGFERLVLSMALRRLSRAGRLARRIALVGNGETVAAAIDLLSAGGPEEVDICGYFDDRDDRRSPDVVAGYPKLGNVEDLVEFSRWFRIDTIVVTLPLTAETRLLEVLHRLWQIPADIRISALGSKLRLNRRAYSKIGSLPLLDTFDRPISAWNHVLKSAFDRAAAALALVLLCPVMLATAIAVRLDSPGPVLFRQRRYGFNNELIEVLKFRSMRHEASDADASQLVTRDDDRVTGVGRFIRKTSLDELPQFFNVLTGELSLVGPRPHALKAKAGDELYDRVVEGYLARHRVKPGVTGLAQIRGWRGETDTHDKIRRRVESDIEYIDRWSIWLDLYILAATPLSLLNTRHAY